MEAIKLTIDWNAEPNAPDVVLSINGSTIILDFYVNYFLFEKFKENERAKVTFKNCHKYSFNPMNDEGYYKGQYRYTNTDLPWGEFYKLNTNWQTDFPNHYTVSSEIDEMDGLNHYIFFFRDNTFECVAENYSIEFYQRTTQ